LLNGNKIVAAMQVVKDIEYAEHRTEDGLTALR
jgi:hypothetical protein